MKPNVTKTFKLLVATHFLNVIHTFAKLFQYPSINDKIMGWAQPLMLFYEALTLKKSDLDL